MPLQRDILDRVERVLDFHRATKWFAADVSTHRPMSPSPRPQAFRVFDMFDKTALPTTLLDVSTGAVALLESGLDALPASHVTPPQDLKTLATWLYMAYGIRQGGRTCPSHGQCFPCEIYVAAFAVDGLESGFYHYSVREFALRKLRDGGETLWRIKRGRPDLEFLKQVPAVVLVSTVYCRSSWMYRRRGYRAALVDAGHLVQNFITAGTGIGMQVFGRMQLNDTTARELIGLPSDMEFADAESVQAAVVWADQAVKTPVSPVPSPHPAPTIPREPLAADIPAFASIMAAHTDCVAAGVAMREMRPPLTELRPIPEDMIPTDLPPPQDGDGHPLRQVLLQSPLRPPIQRGTISRNDLTRMNRAAFRGGSVYPIKPDGPHIGLVRPFWVVLDVAGMNAGTWYYHPPTDEWFVMAEGRFRPDLRAIVVNDTDHVAAEASAVCFMLANLHALTTQAGPDAYRLANLEAGICGRRIELAAAALDSVARPILEFLDDAARDFLGAGRTAWEALYAVAIGPPVRAAAPVAEEPDTQRADLWRG